MFALYKEHTFLNVQSRQNAIQTICFIIFFESFPYKTNFISGNIEYPLPPLLRAASNLNAVDMIEAEMAGVVAWKVRPGQTVEVGETLGEIVDITNVDAPRLPVKSKTSGLVYGMRSHKLVRPGQIIIKVAGENSLEWRAGNLLTA
jgi:hypothetical protein